MKQEKEQAETEWKEEEQVFLVDLERSQFG